MLQSVNKRKTSLFLALHLIAVFLLDLIAKTAKSLFFHSLVQNFIGRITSLYNFTSMADLRGGKCPRRWLVGMITHGFLDQPWCG